MDDISELWSALNQTSYVLASALTVANLLAIWVGVSRRHWCLRLLVLAACGWAVIAARVYEGAAFLTVQGVGTFLLLATFRRGRQDAAAVASAVSSPLGSTRWRVRFHLSDMLSRLNGPVISGEPCWIWRPAANRWKT